MPWTYVISDLKGEEIVETFYEKELQKTNQKEFRVENVPKSSEGREKVELDLSNYATKADLKNVTGVDTPKFVKKVDLANLKSDVDKLDIDKLKNAPTNLSNLKSKVDKLDVDKLVPVPVDLSKLSDVVKNDVVRKRCI